MARVLFVTQYYPPEAGASANITGDIAAGLVRLGHDVTVLTCLPNYPVGVVPPEYRDKRRRIEVIDGVRVVRVWSVIRPNSGFFTRITGMLSFGMLAGFEGRRKVGRQDVVITVSPPLFTSLAGRRLANKLHAPLIFNVHDLWPESAVRLGALHNRLFIWLAERLEWTTYRRARTVWAVTDGMRDTLLQRGVPESKLLMLRLGVNMSHFGRLDQASARAILGWGDGFYVLHAGTIGLTQDWDSLLGAAEVLRPYPDVRIMLAGDGAERPRLEDEVRRRGLANVTLLGMQPLDRLSTMLSAADVSLMNFRKLDFFAGTLPTRMYEAMASSRPFLLTADGLARQLAIEEAGAGLYVEPGNAQALAQAILHLRGHPELARELGARGRAYADATFNRAQTIARLSAHIKALVAGGGTRKQAEVASVAVPARE